METTPAATTADLELDKILTALQDAVAAKNELEIKRLKKEAHALMRANAKKSVSLDAATVLALYAGYDASAAPVEATQTDLDKLLADLQNAAAPADATEVERRNRTATMLLEAGHRGTVAIDPTQLRLLQMALTHPLAPTEPSGGTVGSPTNSGEPSPELSRSVPLKVKHSLADAAAAPVAANSNNGPAAPVVSSQDKMLEEYGQKIAQANELFRRGRKVNAEDFEKVDKALRGVSNQTWFGTEQQPPGAPLENPAPTPDFVYDLSKVPSHFASYLWESFNDARNPFSCKEDLKTCKDKGFFTVLVTSAAGASILIAIPTVEQYLKNGEKIQSVLGALFNNATVPSAVADVAVGGGIVTNVAENALGMTIVVVALAEFLRRYVFPTWAGNAHENELITDRDKTPLQRFGKKFKDILKTLLLTVPPSVPGAVVYMFAAQQQGTALSFWDIFWATSIFVSGVVQFMLPLSSLNALTHTADWNAITNDLDINNRIWINHFQRNRVEAMDLHDLFYAKIHENSADMLYAMQTLNVMGNPKRITLHRQARQLNRLGRFLEDNTTFGKPLRNLNFQLSMVPILAFTFSSAYGGTDVGIINAIGLSFFFVIFGTITYLIYAKLFGGGDQGFLEKFTSTQTTRASLAPWKSGLGVVFGILLLAVMIASPFSGATAMLTLITAVLALASSLTGEKVTLNNLNTLSRGVIGSTATIAAIKTGQLNLSYSKDAVDDSKVFVAEHVDFWTRDHDLRVALRFNGTFEKRIKTMQEMPRSQQLPVLEEIFTPDVNGRYHPEAEYLLALYMKRGIDLAVLPYLNKGKIDAIIAQNPSVLLPVEVVEKEAHEYPQPVPVAAAVAVAGGPSRFERWRDNTSSSMHDTWTSMTKGFKRGTTGTETQKLLDNSQPGRLSFNGSSV